jgi:hypothetical protein
MFRVPLAHLFAFLAFAFVAHAQVPVGDIPPTLSLPPIKELPPPPSVPILPKADPKSAPPPPASEPDKSAPIPQSPPLSVSARAALPPQSKPAGASSAGQFVIRGAELQTRSLMLKRCEGVALEMRSLLRDKTDGSIPIVIAIRTAPDLNPALPAVSPSISALAHGGFHLQLSVQARPDFSPEEMRKELIRLLLVERILRGHGQITPKGRILPDWLLVGVNEALEFRSRTKPSALFSAVFRTGKVFGIEEILEAEPASLDALSRAIYNTSCCALVLALLDQPDGTLSFNKFLHALPTDPRDNKALLSQWFPNLGLSASSLEKWWSLKMANLAKPSVFETLTAAESMTALTSALYFRYDNTVSSPSRSSSTRRTSSAPATTEATPPEEPEDKPGFIRRLFTRDEKAAAEEEKATTPPAKPEKPAEAPPAEEKKGPGIIRKFFGGDKEKEPAPEGTDESAFLHLPSAIWHSSSPILALLADKTSATDQTDPFRPIVRILGIGKKKTPEEIAEEEKAKADKAAAKQKEQEAEAAAKLKADEDRAKARADEKAKEAADKAQREADRAKAKAERDAADNPPPPEPPPPQAPVKRATPAKPKVTQVSIPLEDFAKIANRKDLPAICAATGANLVSLERRAHPLFKPIIIRYIAVVGAISEGKTKEVPIMLAELKVASEGALTQASAVQSHLDWYEASQTQNYTGEFDDFLHLPSTIKKELSPRADVISQHLDELEPSKPAQQ